MEKKWGGEWRNISLSVAFALWMASAQRSRTAKSDAESKDGRERQAKKHDCESRDGEDMSDSKEERSNKTGRTLPIRLCFTSHCTAEENLSYAFALHIALTIYVLAWITQLDGCVEKTPINQILFFVFSFLFSFSFSTSQILSVFGTYLLCCFPASNVKVFSTNPLSHAYCMLYSAELVKLLNGKSAHNKTSLCVCPTQQPNIQTALSGIDPALKRRKWLSFNKEKSDRVWGNYIIFFWVTIGQFKLCKPGQAAELITVRIQKIMNISDSDPYK